MPNVLRDVEYLVSLCDRSSPVGKKGWDTLNPGDTPGLTQVYAQSYAQRKTQAIEQVREALDTALAENK